MGEAMGFCGVLGDGAAGDRTALGVDFRRLLFFIGEGIPVVMRLGGPKPPEDEATPIDVGILAGGLLIEDEGMAFRLLRGGTPALALVGRL